MKTEERLKELIKALDYCCLDYKEILEDYRVYLKGCRQRAKGWDGKDRRDYFISRKDNMYLYWDGLERRS